MSPPREAIQAAIESAQLSVCRNSRRGAAVFRTLGNGEVRILGQGHNRLPGDGHCATACANTSCGKRAMHAEQSAILKATWYAGAHEPSWPVLVLSGADLLHIRVDLGQKVPSREPRCVPCAALALHVGIAGVWLYHEHGWRRYLAEEFYKISCERGDQ